MKLRCLILLALGLVAGCGDSRFAPVSGTIRMDGKPLANVSVIFQPNGKEVNPGPGSSGRTNEQGEYSLQAMGTGVRGAVIGEHRVLIQPTVASGPDDTRPTSTVAIPKRYNYLTQLTFSVKQGNNTADFDLSSK
jgi:hypothetical protein